MKQMITLSRVYQFSAAHRLHSTALSAEKNQIIFDKCNNPNGHGHDYIVEVSVAGEPEEQTGMIIDLQKLDRAVQSVLSELDYKHLDKEVPFFKRHLSTGENIVQYLFRKISERLPEVEVYYLKLQETNNNYFEVVKE